MAKSMLQKLDNFDNESFYDAIVECCLTYQDYGQLLVELLEYFSGSKGWDDKVADLLEEMYSDYYFASLND